MISVMLRSLRSSLSIAARNNRIASYCTMWDTPFDLGRIITVRRRKLPNSKVCILGTNCRIGQQIAFLLKIHPFVAHLALYDQRSNFSCTLATFLSELTTRTEVVGFWGERDVDIADALDGSDLVIVTTGVLKPETRSKDLYNESVGNVRKLCTAIVEHCSQACVHMVSNPKCSLPIAKEVFQKAGTYDWTKLFGVLCDHVATTPAGSTPEDEDIWPVTTERINFGMDNFEGSPEDASAIAFASVALADDYLCTLNKRSSVFSFMDSTHASHIKLMTSNPFLVGYDQTKSPPENNGNQKTEDLIECNPQHSNGWSNKTQQQGRTPNLSCRPEIFSRTLS